MATGSTRDVALTSDCAGAVREVWIDEESPFVVAAKDLWAMNEGLSGGSLTDVLEKPEKDKIGHRAAMDWLNVSSYDELVEITHVNGHLMSGHQPMRAKPETRTLVRATFRQAV